MFRFGSSSFLLPLLTGLLLWIAMPGSWAIWGLAFIALVPLFWAINRADLRTAAKYGFIAGIIHFGLLLYWLIIVMGRYGGLAWYFSLIGLLMLAVYMTLYVVLFCVVARLLLQAFSPALALWLLPALWVGIDWLRGCLFTGFPWMDLGYVLYKNPVLLQVADLTGHHGVTYLVVFVNSLLFLLIAKRHPPSTTRVLLLSAICLLAGAGWYSMEKFDRVSHQVQARVTSAVRVGIVQGNIDQSVKWSPQQQRATVEKYLAQTRKLATDKGGTLVVWPETALPFYPPANTLMELLIKEATDLDLGILTGAPWYEIVNQRTRDVKFFNSAVLLRPDGLYGGRYDKAHLVPFGEYVPLKKLLPFLAPLVEAVGDFSPGTIGKPLVWQQARAGILICFESVFPELSRHWVINGANLLINLTNDAWYGKSSAPYHSLAMAVLRTVESRRSMVRAANTGISAFISPNGTITERSEIFVSWQAATKVVLFEELTVWARYGYLFGPGCLVCAIMAVSAAVVRRRREMNSAHVF